MKTVKFLLPQKNRAFTLIELLVVIGVIAIMAGLLLPVLAKASERAKRVVCINNMHQMAIGTRIWADDRKGEFPTLRGDSSNVIWDGRRYRGYGKIIEFQLDKDARIFFCPSSEYFRSSSTNGVDTLGKTNQITFSSYYFRGTRQGGPRSDGRASGKVLLSDFDAREFVTSGMWLNQNHPTGKNVLHKDGSADFVRGQLDSRDANHGGPGTVGTNKVPGTWFKLDNPERFK